MSEPRLLVTVPGETLRRAIGTPPDGVDIELWDLAGPAPADRIDLVVPPYMGAADRLGALAGVTTRLVQSQSIGYDDVPAASLFWPGLTTVRQQMRAMGSAACRSLMAQMNGESQDRSVLEFPMDLVVRQSTGPSSDKKA